MWKIKYNFILNCGPFYTLLTSQHPVMARRDGRNGRELYVAYIDEKLNIKGNVKLNIIITFLCFRLLFALTENVITLVCSSYLFGFCFVLCFNTFFRDNRSR